MLNGRKLWKDGDWNTLCLPFDVTIADSPLKDDGVEVRTLNSSDFEDDTEKHNLYLGSGNTLYYPTAEGFQLKSCRGWFQLKGGLTAGEPKSGSPNLVRAFSLNFGNESTGIVEITDPTPGPSPAWEGRSAAWYDLSGRRISVPSASSANSVLPKGVYINNGRKVVIK